MSVNSNQVAKICLFPDPIGITIKIFRGMVIRKHAFVSPSLLFQYLCLEAVSFQNSFLESGELSLRFQCIEENVSIYMEQLHLFQDTRQLIF